MSNAIKLLNFIYIYIYDQYHYLILINKYNRNQKYSI